MARRQLVVVVIATLGSGSLACTEAGNVLPVPHDAGPAPVETATPRVEGPYLTALSLKSTAVGSDMELTPHFSPNIFDYYVWCAEGTNVVEVSMTSASGATSALVPPTRAITSYSATQAVTLNVNANDAIVAVATDDTAKSEYWVRCLPSDMTRWTWLPHPEKGTPSPGYYLVGDLYPRLIPYMDLSGYAMVLNGDGVPVWYERVIPNELGAGNFDSLAPGMISYMPVNSSTSTDAFTIRSLDPLTTNVLPGPVDAWKYSTDFHELRLLPNGDYLMLGSFDTPGVDLTGLDVKMPNGKMEVWGGTAVIQECAVLEFNAAGTLVWSWRGSEHFDPKEVSTLPYYDGSEVVVFHCNSIDVDPMNGNLLVSAREMGSIFYIEYPSGTVLWKMGGPNSSKDNAAYVSVPDAFSGQHDARLLPGWCPTCNGGTGQISVFDDEYGTIGRPARGVVYDVVVGSSDGGTDGGRGGGAPGTATVAWQYQGTTNSQVMGSFRIASDGSRIICWGEGGTSFVFSELDAQGNDLLDFSYEDGDLSYRAIKVPLSTFDLGVLRRTAGLP
jgi:Arylsulfotransferase (ASST)